LFKGSQVVDARFKFIFLVAVLFMTALPLIGILQGPEKPPSIPGEEGAVPLDLNSAEPQSGDLGKAPLSAEMVLIPAGEFIRGTNSGDRKSVV
jgi:hypothetical protein